MQYYTLYQTSYGTVKAPFQSWINFSYEEAVRTGSDWCVTNGHTYLGTYTEDEIYDAEVKHREILYGEVNE